MLKEERVGERDGGDGNNRGKQESDGWVSGGHVEHGKDITEAAADVEHISARRVHDGAAGSDCQGKFGQ